MKVREALIAWTPPEMDVGSPTNGQVRVGYLPASRDARDWSDAFTCTGGAAWARTRTLNGTSASAQVFAEFNEIVVEGGIAPEVAHRAFWAIDEYREAISNRDFYRLQPRRIRRS